MGKIKTLKKLQKRADEINLFDKNELKKFMKIMDELKDTLYKDKELIAVAAPQLGYPYRIFCIKFANGDIRGFANPMCTKVKGFKFSREVQIGVNDTEYFMPRFEEIGVTYQTPLGKIESNIFQGTAAIIFQQMLNLIDGVLLKDIGLEILPGFDNLAIKDKEEIINLYINKLRLENDVLSSKISEDKELSLLNDTINLLTKRNLASVTPIKEDGKNV